MHGSICICPTAAPFRIKSLRKPLPASNATKTPASSYVNRCISMYVQDLGTICKLQLLLHKGTACSTKGKPGYALDATLQLACCQLDALSSTLTLHCHTLGVKTTRLPVMRDCAHRTTCSPAHSPAAVLVMTPGVTRLEIMQQKCPHA
jgi:hypothetical protein